MSSLLTARFLSYSEFIELEEVDSQMEKIRKEIPLVEYDSEEYRKLVKEHDGLAKYARKLAKLA